MFFRQPVLNGDIYVIDADGTHATRLTHNRFHEFAPVFSPDGTMIAFVQWGGAHPYERRNRIWTMLADGSERTPLFAPAQYPDWQPV